MKELVCIIGMKMNVNMCMEGGLVWVEEMEWGGWMEGKVDVEGLEEVEKLK